tara:strand:+ start:585 stop:707 length:123 start_codon:yes stop_codon:yes gene_type:complete
MVVFLSVKNVYIFQFIRFLFDKDIQNIRAAQILQHLLAMG